MEGAFELNREEEILLHDQILKERRLKQRNAFRPGLNSNQQSIDVVLKDRTAKKLTRAYEVLQQEYNVKEQIIHDVLSYTNNLQDALSFLTYQYTSDELPSKLRASTSTGSTGTVGATGDIDQATLTVVPNDKKNTEEETQPEPIKKNDDVDNWEGLESPKRTDASSNKQPTIDDTTSKTEEIDDAKSWTQRYLMMMEQQELEEANKPKETKEDKIKALEDQYGDILQQCQAAKKKKQKSKQKELNAQLQEIRKDLIALGWNEEDYRMRQYSKPVKKVEEEVGEVVPETKVEVSKSTKEETGQTDDDEMQYGGGGLFGSTEDDVDNADDDEMQYGGGLFGNTSDHEEGMTAIKVSSSSSNTNGNVSASTDTTETSAPPVRKYNTSSGTWTGKSARDHLQEYCQKRKYPRPQFNKLSGDKSSRGFMYNVIVTIKGKKKEYQLIDAFGGAVHGFDTMDDARNAVATRALYELNPDLQLYSVLPPFFRDMWLQWLEEKKQKENASKNSIKQAFDQVIDSILTSIPVEISTKQVTFTEEREPNTSAAVASNTTKPNGVAKQEDECEEEGSIADDWDAEYSDDEQEQDTKATEGKSPIKSSAVSSQFKIEPDAELPRLQSVFQERQKSKFYQQHLKFRQKLPIANFKKEILNALDTNDIVLVSGETGCGKSTQVPHFILEEMLSRQDTKRCNILCTQPRRIAAISVAERVSKEMGEKKIAEQDSLCGYQIRLENRMTSSTRLCFCTTGIVLRRLQTPGALEEMTHIIVDEVHERDVQNDVLLCILKEKLLQPNNHLKVILMSATLNADIFQSYFGGTSKCSILKVPGRTFPVDEFFLEDALELTKHVVDPESRCYLPIEEPRDSIQLKISGRGGTSYTQTVTWKKEQVASKTRHEEKNDDISSMMEKYSEHTCDMLSRIDFSVINYELIEELVVYLFETNEMGHTSQKSSAILIFLPGSQEITTLIDILTTNRTLRDEKKFNVLPLHSGLSPLDQQKVFDMTPGVIKIIAATNIAETSLTIEDVKVVIDTGRVKQMRHDTQKRTSFLEETWASRANVKQRKGRAGRVSGGTCYFLFPRSVYTHAMDEQPIPEMMRAPLTSLCLQIKTFGLGDCREFLGRVLEPPNIANIEDALEELYEIGALMDQIDLKEELTSLGKHLAQLPVDVKVGKMLIYGALFGCLDTISTIAAILETKSPFVAPIGRQKEMNAARKAFFLGNSDLLTDANAYQQWEAIQKRSKKEEQDFCWKFFLNRRALTEISKLKKQFRSLLSSMGFVEKKSIDDKLNESSIPLISAIICAGLTPNVLHVEKKSKNRVVLQDQKQEVLVHPSSVNHGIIEYPSPWVSYHYKLFTSNVYVPISNMVTTSAMIIFSGKCDVFVDRGIIKLNDWIQLTISPRSATIFKELREHVIELLLEAIDNPLLLQKPDKMEHFDQTTRAIKDILNTEYNLLDPTLALRKIQNK